MNNYDTYTFRIDDISVNTDIKKLKTIVDSIYKFSKLKNINSIVVFGISCMAFDMQEFPAPENERLFPKILNAHSDHRCFYDVQKIGIPDLSSILNNTKTDSIYPNVKFRVCPHGLTHVDHRLLSKDVQEFNILCSLSLVQNYFPEYAINKYIMPFNKYNQDTKDICYAHGIDILAWDVNWQHMKYIDPSDKSLSDKRKFYFHTHDFSDTVEFITTLNTIL